MAEKIGNQRARSSSYAGEVRKQQGLNLRLQVRGVKFGCIKRGRKKNRRFVAGQNRPKLDVSSEEEEKKKGEGRENRKIQSAVTR